MFSAVAAAIDSARTRLSMQELLTGLSTPIDMSAFQPVQASPALHQFEGTLQLDVATVQGGFEVLKDSTGIAVNPAWRVRQLPAFKFDFVQVGDQLVPVRRGAIPSRHPHWEYILEPGRVWQESADGGFARAALPFSLQERNANCTHNGVMSFLFKGDGTVSNVAYQISSETCLYFKFNMWGVTQARYLPGKVPGKKQLSVAHQQHLSKRLPVKPIAALAQDYPGSDPQAFSGRGLIDAEHMSVYGFVIDGQHYRSPCQTRHGAYPFCDVMDLPSYSLAKSLVAGLGLMRMEKLFPNVKDALIANYVPDCARGEQWRDTTFAHALDMSSGNFISPTYNDDEVSTAKEQDFFLQDSHQGNIRFACQHFPRKTAPGTRWVYHTSDTYVLGTAMNAFLRNESHQYRDIYADILQPLWAPLALSPTSRVSRRTYDDVAQVFTGYGLTLQTDDIAKLASFVNSNDIRLEVDSTLLDSALQRNALDPGLPAVEGKFHYNNGFWALPAAGEFNCPAPLALPFMLGYGGIIVVLLPNQTVYYYFSDNAQFKWLAAAQASHRLRSLCPDSHAATQ